MSTQQSPKKRIAILGSTGSIGTQALKVIDEHLEKFEVEVLCAYNNYELLIQQAIKYQPNAVVIINQHHYATVSEALQSHQIKVFKGEQSLQESLSMSTIDLCLNAIVGSAGLLPTVIAIKNKIPVALANKETLVMGGEIISTLQRTYNAPIIPVDSEHSAILQCLLGEFSPISKLILTASGGPFIGRTEEELKNVTIQEALKHPSWSMGKKITVDSATLVNKALEIIEAKYLFNLHPDKIKVVIHPKSMVHSMVEFADGSLKAQLGVPDMRTSIAFAFSYPNRVALSTPKIDFEQPFSLEFIPPNAVQQRSLNLAYTVLRKGGVLPCVLNAANEVAVQAFLDTQLLFHHIVPTIEKVLNQYNSYGEANNIEDLIQIDRETRTVTSEIIKHTSNN